MLDYARCVLLWSPFTPDRFAPRPPCCRPASRAAAAPDFACRLALNCLTLAGSVIVCCEHAHHPHETSLLKSLFCLFLLVSSLARHVRATEMFKYLNDFRKRAGTKYMGGPFFSCPTLSRRVSGSE
jgi:hypothetical protein